MRLKLALATVVVSALASSAMADTVIFSDNFNAQNGGTGALNFTGFNMPTWTVSDGTVDLIGNGYFDFLPGNGLYIDLDGSTGNAGVLSTPALGLVAGYTYEMTFSLAGNRRNSSSETVTVNVSVGAFNENFSLPQNAGFTVYTRTFTATGDGVLSFSNAGGDNIGMLLDNVQVTLVPLPSGVLMGAAGLGLTGFLARRRFGR